MSPRISLEEQAKQNVELLLDYAAAKLNLDALDAIYARNRLLARLELTAPCEGETGKTKDIYALLSELSSYAVRERIIKEEDRALFETELIGLVCPPPSAVVERFDGIARFEGVEKACDYLLALSENSTYIRRPDINKNIVWEYDNPRGKIGISVNLAKPEKTPEEVKRAKEAKTGYPKCVLCMDNLGFQGNAAFAARETIRIIPLELDGEEWFMQFSPYVYFEQHVIAISAVHRPMAISEKTFARMTDFVDAFPHYFIGSNAALPIVGGSVLAHDHYQGGKKVLPMLSRPALKHYLINGFADVSVSVADWYNSVVRLESKNKAQLIAAADKFRRAWEDYTDNSANVIAHTIENGESVPHNAVTPVCYFNDNGEYRIDLILRNNRTDAAHPFGIFHPAEELHNIKQESIGLIEAMGLFILPGRLQSEAEQIKDLLTGAVKLDFEKLSDAAHPLNKHFGMIAQLVSDYGTGISEQTAGDAVTDYINRACEKILDTTAVFKHTPQGEESFDKFIRSVTEA